MRFSTTFQCYSGFEVINCTFPYRNVLFIAEKADFLMFVDVSLRKNVVEVTYDDIRSMPDFLQILLMDSTSHYIPEYLIFIHELPI